jgi:hypothetical protein
MGSKTMQRSPAFPPVLTSYKLREIERLVKGDTFATSLSSALLLDSRVLGSRVVREANLCLRLLKNKGFKDESMTKGGSYTIDTSTTLASNKSQNETASRLQRLAAAHPTAITHAVKNPTALSPP